MFQFLWKITAYFGKGENQEKYSVRFELVLVTDNKLLPDAKANYFIF
jgi:hypothetical protein